MSRQHGHHHHHHHGNHRAPLPTTTPTPMNHHHHHHMHGHDMQHGMTTPPEPAITTTTATERMGHHHHHHHLHQDSATTHAMNTNTATPTTSFGTADNSFVKNAHEGHQHGTMDHKHMMNGHGIHQGHGQGHMHHNHDLDSGHGGHDHTSGHGGHAMHDGMAMSHDMHMSHSKPVFRWVTDVHVLFEQWTTSTILELAMAMLTAAALAALYEWLRFWLSGWDNANTCYTNMPAWKRLVYRSTRSILHSLNAAVGYLQMLFAMTFDLRIFVAVILGSGLGFLVLGPYFRGVATKETAARKGKSKEDKSFIENELLVPDPEPSCHGNAATPSGSGQGETGTRLLNEDTNLRSNEDGTENRHQRHLENEFLSHETDRVHHDRRLSSDGRTSLSDVESGPVFGREDPNKLWQENDTTWMLYSSGAGHNNNEREIASAVIRDTVV